MIKEEYIKAHKEFMANHPNCTSYCTAKEIRHDNTIHNGRTILCGEELDENGLCKKHGHLIG